LCPLFCVKIYNASLPSQIFNFGSTGKTLTAEAISEMLHRPLYSVSIGQLGTKPDELEEKLGDILDLCSRWDCLILLCVYKILL